MLRPVEIVNGISGCLRLLRLDPAGAAYFDNTAAAAWRSFRVLLLALPAYALIRTLTYERYDSAVSTLETILIEALFYVAQWCLNPVIAFELARFFALRRDYPRYVAAINWMSLVQLHVAIPLVALAGFAPAWQGAISMVLLLLAMICTTVTARLVLGAGWAMAFGLFVLEIVAGELLRALVDRALGFVHV